MTYSPASSFAIFCFFSFFLSFFSFFSFFFVIGARALRNGLNREHFPYYETDETETILDRPYSETDFNRSLFFCAVVCAYVFLGLLLYEWFLRRYFPRLHTLLDDVTRRVRQPHTMSLVVLILTANLFFTLSTLFVSNRIWYAHLETNSTGFGVMCPE